MLPGDPIASASTSPSPSPIEVLRAFLKLGLTAFGGPVAHLGYLRQEFVHRRRWLDDAHFAQLLAICQFLPGPASSQLGFAIGLVRAGWRGAVCAFVGFTLPAALLMFGFATVAPFLGHGVGAAALHGLKLVAVAVVAHALLGMARQLAPDAPRALIALVTLAMLLAVAGAWMQVLAIALGGLLGLCLCRKVHSTLVAPLLVPGGMRAARWCFVLFLGGLLAALWRPVTATPDITQVAGAFYQAGALVFGGGHVVLPLLEHGLVDSGWVDAETFLAGYGAAQAVPGPMFSFAAFLGAEIPLDLPAACGAAVALLAVFLPGFLLLMAALPVWSWLSTQPLARSALAGMNAAVVGLLAAALYDPVCTQGLRSWPDLLVAGAGFALLTVARVSALWVVVGCVIASVAMHLAGA